MDDDRRAGHTLELHHQDRRRGAVRHLLCHPALSQSPRHILRVVVDGAGLVPVGRCRRVLALIVQPARDHTDPDGQGLTAAHRLLALVRAGPTWDPPSDGARRDPYRRANGVHCRGIIDLETQDVHPQTRREQGGVVGTVQDGQMDVSGWGEPELCTQGEGGRPVLCGLRERCCGQQRARHLLARLSCQCLARPTHPARRRRWWSPRRWIAPLQCLLCRGIRQEHPPWRPAGRTSVWP